MNDFNLNNNPQPKFSSTLLVIGVGIILLGCLLALDSLTIYRFGIRPMRFWPMIIVALGVVKILESKFRKMSGWIITTVGLLLLAHSISGASIENLIGPAIMIAFGVFVVLHALKRHRKVPPELQKSEGFAHGTAILGEYKHKPTEGQFNGGEVTAIFGGFEVDLRQTTMKHDTARLDVFVMCSGGVIRIPEGWDVSIRASAIAGAVDDKRVPLPATDVRRPKLLITGTILFGGIELK